MESERRAGTVVDAGRYNEDDLIPAIDAGAEDIARDDDETRGVHHRRAGAKPAIVDGPVERGDAGASHQ